MSPLPYFAKALYEFKSDYEDDLSFSAGQLIKVTAVEDDEWLTGEYSDAAGALKSGMFPKNFVSELVSEGKDEAEQPGKAADGEDNKKGVNNGQGVSQVPSQSEYVEKDLPADTVKSSRTGGSIETATSVKSGVSQEEPITSPIHKEGKRSSFSHAFSSKVSTFDSGAPIPTPLSSNPFAKEGHKSDVRPYQGHSSYIPPSINKTTTPSKTNNSHSSYVPPPLGKSKHQQDAEANIANPPPVADKTNDHFAEEEEGPKLSLKERIALLQKQQAEEAERKAAAAAKKKQQKEAKAGSTAKPTQEPIIASHDATNGDEEAESTILKKEEPVPEIPRNFVDLTKEEPKTQPIEISDSEDIQEEGETQEPETIEGHDDDEEDDLSSDEEDEEEAKRTALRQRMAKLAGAGGMYGPQGGFNPFGMPTGGAPAKKSTKSSKPKEKEVESTNYAPPVTILPFAGGSAPQVPDVLKRKSTVNEDEFQDKSEPLQAAASDPDNDLETVKGGSPVAPEQESQNIDAIDQYASHDEQNETLVKKLQNLDLSGTSRNVLSESAIEGDDENDDDDYKSSSDDVDFLESDRQREIESLNLKAPLSNTDAKILQAVQSDYTTGYESDDDSQFPKTHKDTSTNEHQSGAQTSALPAGAPPGLPRLDTNITSTKRAPATPAPPIPGSTQSPSVASVPPPIPGNSSFASPTSGPPAIPHHSKIPVPPLPSTVAAPPIPSGGRAPSLPTETHYEEPQEEHDDLKSVNSSIVSPIQASNYSFSHQSPIPGGDNITPSRQLRKSNTGQSTFSETSSIAQKYSSISHTNTGNSITSITEVGVKKAPLSFNSTTDFNKFDKESIDKFDIGSKWWLRNELPGSLSAKVNKELIFEVDENKVPRRDGTSLVVKSYYILHQDNSQTIYHLTYVVPSVDETLTSFQVLTKPAPEFNQNFLDAHAKDFGSQVLQIANRLLNHNQTLSTPLIPYIFQQLSKEHPVLPNVGLRSYGATIYSNANNVEVQQLTIFKPGDIVAINKAKFQGHNKLRQKLIYDVGVDKSGPLAAVLTEFDFEKKKFRVIEVDSKGKIRQNSYKPSDLKSGKIKVFRVVGRGYIGW
jgi:hypothetical protein